MTVKRHEHPDKLYEYKGKRQPLREWAKEIGVSVSTIRDRLRNHTFEEAVTMKHQIHRPVHPQLMTTYQGKEITVHNLSIITGISYPALRYRILKRGLSGDDAAALPIRKRTPSDKYPGCCYPDCFNCPFDDCLIPSNEC